MILSSWVNKMDPFGFRRRARGISWRDDRTCKSLKQGKQLARGNIQSDTSVTRAPDVATLFNDTGRHAVRTLPDLDLVAVSESALPVSN
jgi:hypothetical protein